MYLEVIETNKLLHENESLLNEEITIEMVSKIGFISEEEILKVMKEKGAEDLEDLYFKTRDEVRELKIKRAKEKIDEYFKENY